MNPEEILTPRERQVAELLSWGASAKEIPGHLVEKYGGQEISVNTVRNITSNIFTKLQISKVSELSAWWFCNVEGVDSSHSPIKRRIRVQLYSVMFLLIMLPSLFNADQTAVRPQRIRTQRVENISRTGRRKD